MSAKVLMAGAVLVGASSLGVASLWSHRGAAESDEADARRTEAAKGARVEVGTVKAALPVRSVTLTGEVHAYRQATLYAKVSGYLRRITVEKGQAVKEGDILGIVDSPESDQDRLTKVAVLENKKLVDRRAQALAQGGIVSQQEAEKARADLSVANAELARADALRGYQAIRAPFDGIVTARYADPGALLQAATSSVSALPLVDVADLARVRVQMYLGQDEALDVKEEDHVALWSDAHGEAKVDAKVTRFTHSLDPKTRTMLAEVDVDNRDGALLPGEFVHVRLDVRSPPSLAIPIDAVVMRGGKNLAIVVDKDRATFVPITLGTSDGVAIRVTSGLREGQVVVLHPSDDVVEGARVQVAPVVGVAGGPVGGGGAAGALGSGSTVGEGRAR